jgi:hypothetical protein
MLGKLDAPALRRTGWVVVVTSVIEMAIISVQAARGMRSHFNDDGCSGSLLFAVMGATVVVLYLATIAVALRYLREPGRDRTMVVAIRLGLLVGLVGMGAGFLMTLNGAHTVGLADGGPGLPLLGWSTVGGDPRIPHFVGMHAIQLLPLLAAALATFTRGLDEAARVRVVVVAGLAHLAVVLLLGWQTMRAQPLLSPDAVTLGALVAVLVAVAVGIRPATSRRAVAAGV